METIINLKKKGEFESMMAKKDVKVFIKTLNLRHKMFTDMESKF